MVNRLVMTTSYFSCDGGELNVPRGGGGGGVSQCSRAGFQHSAAKSGKPGHNRDIGPNSGTVPAKLGHSATM